MLSLAPWMLGAAGGLLGAIWALWERVRRVRAEGSLRETTSTLSQAQAANAKLSDNALEGDRRRENVIRMLETEVSKADAAGRPLHGDTLEQLRDLLRSPTKAH